MLWDKNNGRVPPVQLVVKLTASGTVTYTSSLNADVVLNINSA